MKFFEKLEKFVTNTLNRIRRRSDEEVVITGGWSRDIDRHNFGEYSYATARGKEGIEEFSQIEIGRNATFVGVYDGHGGSQASRFLADNFFPNFIGVVRDRFGMISRECLERAFSLSEDGFSTLAIQNPDVREVGSSCLAGVICNRQLLVGNLGDSGAVIGRECKRNFTTKITAVRITKVHHLSQDDERVEVQRTHSYDPNIVVLDIEDQKWRIRDALQVTRSIGDLHLKKPEYARVPIRTAVLSAVPSLEHIYLTPADKFVIFASNGLWDNLSEQRVVKTITKYPREGIAKRLITKAVKVADKKRRDTIALGMGLEFHREGHLRYDDMSVVVIYIDSLMNSMLAFPEISVTSHKSHIEGSLFKTMNEKRRSYNDGASTSGTK